MQKKILVLLAAYLSLIAGQHAYADPEADRFPNEYSDYADIEHRFSLGSSDGKFKINLRGHLQQENEFSRIVSTKTNDIDMKINRARISLGGHAFDPRISFFFQTGWEANSAGVLRDYYLNTEHYDRELQFRFGKFVVPFSRQQIASSASYQFGDLRNADRYFQINSENRDVGLMLHNGHHNSFEWAFAALSSGIVARIGYNHNDIDGYELSDFTGGDLRFGVGASGYLATDYMTKELTNVYGNADFIVKYEGFSTNAAFLFKRTKERGVIKAEHSFGGGIDFGYLINRRYEPVVRYSWVKEGDPNTHEAILGLNYYVLGNHLKAHTYVGADLQDKEINKWKGGVQLQFAL